MTSSLYDRLGHRKYLVESERRAFVQAALRQPPPIASFCITLAVTGARISEVLLLTADRIDFPNEAIVFHTLKQRGNPRFRAVPVPSSLLSQLMNVLPMEQKRLWPWGRTTAWKLVKKSMMMAGIAEPLCKPKALRHGFAVDAGCNGVQLNIIQRWLGHSRIETTSIYTNVIGKEERALARRTWRCLGNRHSIADDETK